LHKDGNQENFTEDVLMIPVHGNGYGEAVSSIVLEGSKVQAKCGNTAKAWWDLCMP